MGWGKEEHENELHFLCWVDRLVLLTGVGWFCPAGLEWRWLAGSQVIFRPELATDWCWHLDSDWHRNPTPHEALGSE